MNLLREFRLNLLDFFLDRGYIALIEIAAPGCLGVLLHRRGVVRKLVDIDRLTAYARCRKRLLHFTLRRNIRCNEHQIRV